MLTWPLLCCVAQAVSACISNLPKRSSMAPMDARRFAPTGGRPHHLFWWASRSHAVQHLRERGYLRERLHIEPSKTFFHGPIELTVCCACVDTDLLLCASSMYVIALQTLCTPARRWRPAFCSQGGGLYIEGQAALYECNVYQNTADYVSSSNIYLSSSGTLALPVGTSVTGLSNNGVLTYVSLPPPLPPPPGPVLETLPTCWSTEL